MATASYVYWCNPVPYLATQGFGCMGITSFYGKPMEDEAAIKLMAHAYKRGVTHFDTAEVYTCKADDGTPPLIRIPLPVLTPPLIFYAIFMGNHRTKTWNVVEGTRTPARLTTARPL